MREFQGNTADGGGESGLDAERDRRFYVRAASVNAVRRALFRAPGGAEVIGRYDRDTIECVHTMDSHSLRRHWPVIVSRLEKANLTLVPRPSRVVEDPEFTIDRPASEE